MQSHQRYFPVQTADETLLPAFLYVSNADPTAAALVTRGNQRVLDGRLDDAEFAYDRDLAEGLPAMAGRLGAVVFHEKLGSLADKARRLRRPRRRAGRRGGGARRSRRAARVRRHHGGDDAAADSGDAWRRTSSAPPPWPRPTS